MLRLHDMSIGHYILENQFYCAKWVPNTFSLCELVYDLRLMVIDRGDFGPIWFGFRDFNGLNLKIGFL